MGGKAMAYVSNMPGWLIALATAAGPTLIGLVAWVVRSMVIDRIKALEDAIKHMPSADRVKGLEEANIRQGQRIGELEQGRAVELAVREFSGRVNK